MKRDWLIRIGERPFPELQGPAREYLPEGGYDLQAREFNPGDGDEGAGEPMVDMADEGGN